jgi:hypothetical protein
MNRALSRRDVLVALAAAGGAVTLGAAAGAAQAADLPKLDPKDPAAVALGYIADAKSVDPKTNPTYAAGQACNTCLQLQGKPGDAFRPCNIFPGKLVDANGWCRVWTKKA